MQLLLFLLVASLAWGAKWPYDRYFGHEDDKGRYVPDKERPDLGREDRTNFFVQWLHNVSETQDSGEVKSLFLNNTIPKDVSIRQLFDYLQPPEESKPPSNDTPISHPRLPNVPSREAERLFRHLKYPVDPVCTVDKSRWWFRTYDGSCNWLKQGETNTGQVGTAKARDYNQHMYADGISKPREGPNARAVSNAFFKRKQTIYYEHTPLLLGMVEWIMHDVTYSMDSDLQEDMIEVPVPDDEAHFPKNTTFQVWRTQAVPGTGTSKDKPRENVNMATTWLDLSSLYGSTPEVAKALRSFDGGKLLTQELRTRGESTYGSYLPFNTMGVPMNNRRRGDPTKLFAGGDPRTNEDWLMLGVHTLFLREHNRLCGILARQFPQYNDEELYQTARVALTAKYALMANSYQMAYWTKDMPWPRDDGFPLYRQMYGKNVLQINPMNTYPWPLVTKSGKPMVVSAEMAVVYRFHEFIIPEFPIKDKTNTTLWNQSVFDSGFNAEGFIDAGLENILRGTVGTHIPNFKSGVDETFRSAGQYGGHPFDIVVWSIIHEREQGLPTFNQYFREYNKQGKPITKNEETYSLTNLAEDPKVAVPIRKRFEDFSKDPQVVKDLKRLYKTPDDVDLVVGVQLEEEYFPGTTIPKSALIISLFSLFGMGNSDRFSIGFAATKCLLVDTPFDCNPSNALEDLLWKPVNHTDFPNARWLDSFWLTEFDFQSHGTNLLWRLITENSNVKCLQQYPLFPVDEKTNPVMCTLPKIPPKTTIRTALLSALEAGLALYKQHAILYTIILITIVAAALLWAWSRHRSHGDPPPVLKGWPIIGVALAFAKDPKSVLLKGFRQYGGTTSKVFGLKMGPTTNFVITQSPDLKMMIADNPYEAKFSNRAMMASINVPLIVGKENFDSELHIKLVRTNLSRPETIKALGETAKKACERYMHQHMPQETTHIEEFVPLLMNLITATMAGTIVGTEAQDSPTLLNILATFNDAAYKVMGISSFLPSFLSPIAGIPIWLKYRKARQILVPIIRDRRTLLRTQDKVNSVFIDDVIEAVDDDNKVSDLVVLCIWFGLTNLQAPLIGLIQDIINAPDDVKRSLTENIGSLEVSSLEVFDQPSLLPRDDQDAEHSEPDQNNPWTPLRAAMFETLRLSGSIIGPSRMAVEDVLLPSSTAPGQWHQTLPKSQAAALSAYHIHRAPESYGPTAASWDPRRFRTANPAIGSPRFVSWGLTGPHLCPGRWFAQESILVIARCVLAKYELVPDVKLDDDDKYVYSATNATRKNVGVTLSLRS